VLELDGSSEGESAEVLPKNSMVDGSPLFQVFLRIVEVNGSLSDAWEVADEIMPDRISEYLVAAVAVNPWGLLDQQRVTMRTVGFKGSVAEEICSEWVLEKGGEVPAIN
jgi:hypothetical protein